ncbi:hypothetical protein NEFER03_1581 [Nematocida sp. LUAm3]|nr:hypothetical protein NEFER03_1581 [Nematocida sp. LUAm3]KAI5176388.1 hypothetical protein NEFER02_2162 [Nematocida sp. LUAm2]KAI5179048.1 hypothetical protein NEFER01_1924 [Nematocida sp. LUAm1]
MQRSERERRCSMAIERLIVLINQMREVSNGLYKHTYELEAPLIKINSEVIKGIESILSLPQEPILVSEKAYSFSATADPSISWVVDYLKVEEQRKALNIEMADAKRKDFRMLYEGFQRRKGTE